MTRSEAHKLIDDLFDAAEKSNEAESIAQEPIEGIEVIEAEAVEARVLPKDKRAVRTKQSGDRVYMLDEVKKTRQWVTNPDVLKGLGFEQIDVQDVEEGELLKYQMASALYKVPEDAISIS